MTPSAILTLVTAALAHAPTIAQGVQDARQLIVALFTAQLINATQQDALNGFVDAKQKLHEAGIVPEHWQVQPDPA